MNEEAKPRRSGKKSCCLIGCLGLGLFGIAVLIGGASWIFSISSGFKEADALRAQREEMEAAKPFAPSADGRIPAERLQAYLSARARTMDACARIGGFFDQARRLEEAEDRGEKPGLGEVLGLAGAGFQLPRLLAEYFEARNAALVDHEMSLEEWRWYTVLAYRSAGGAFVREGVDPEREDARGGGNDHELVRRTLVAQLEAARAAGPEAVGADWLALLEAEVARFDEPDATGWPWPDGLPERVRESLAGEEQRLRELHCTGSEDIELDQIERDGVSVQVR